MGSLIVDLDAKLSYYKGALEIKPFVGKKAIERMHERIVQAKPIEENPSPQDRLQAILEEKEPEATPEPVFKASAEKLEDIFVIDADLNISRMAVKLLAEQVIPVYWIRNGKLKAKFEPIPAHGSATVRIAQEISPAQMRPTSLRKFSKKQIQKLRKPLRLKTRKLDRYIGQIREVNDFLRLKNTLLTNPSDELQKEENWWSSMVRPPDNPSRNLLKTILSCIISYQINLSGLLPKGNGYFGTLLESFLIETEISYLDLPLLKKRQPKDHVRILLNQVEKTGLRKKVFYASVKYAQLCKRKQNIRSPGLIK